MSKYVISLSPHVHSGDSVRSNMLGVCLALVPALVASLIFFGLGALVVVVASVVSCVGAEWLLSKYVLGRSGRSIMDGSAVLTGLLLGFNLPSNLPLWLIVVGAFVAIGVGKLTFGGLGQNPFNPALVGRVFLLISFPVQMTSWPMPGQLMSYLDAQTGATPLAQAAMGQVSEVPAAADLLLGHIGGSLGEVSALALIIGAAYMLWRRIITWHIPVSVLGTYAILQSLLYLAEPTANMSPAQGLLSGGLMLGACFMATDYVTSPMSPKGQLIYGAAIGALTVVIRTWGAYPEGMSFAILIMNAFTPLLNTYCKPTRFGEKPQKQAPK